MTVSVVIPVRGSADLLAAAVRSVDRQTVKPCEIIVVDNGASPSALELARSGSSLVRIVKEPSVGAAPARNRGLSVATGRYCAFLDADDLWEERYLERMTAATRAHPRSLLFVGSSFVTIGSEFRHVRPPIFGRRAFHCLMVRNSITTSAALVERQAALSVGGFLEGLQLPAGEDWALWLKLSRLGRVRSVRAAIVYRSESSVSARNTGDPVLYDDIAYAARHALALTMGSPLPRRVRANIAAHRGTHHLRQGQRQAAARCFRHAIILVPTVPANWFWLGMSLLPGRCLRLIRGRPQRSIARQLGQTETNA